DNWGNIPPAMSKQWAKLPNRYRMDTFLLHENALALRYSDYRPRAGIELQKIFFNAIAENDPVLRHLRIQHQRRLTRDSAKYHRRTGRVGGERLAHRVEQVLCVPGKLGSHFQAGFFGQTSARPRCDLLNNLLRRGCSCGLSNRSSASQ